MGDGGSASRRAPATKQVRQAQARGRQNCGRSDMHPSQRSEGDADGKQQLSSGKHQQEEGQRTVVNWYEDGEEEFTLQAIQERDHLAASKVNMQVVKNAGGRKKGKGLTACTAMAARSTRSVTSSGKSGTGTGATTREMWTKYMGKKWPGSSGNAHPGSRRGPMGHRKGDDRFDMYGTYQEYYDECPDDASQETEYHQPSTRKFAYPCKYYAASRCSKGDSCPFMHEAADSLSYQTDSFGPFSDAVPSVCPNWYYHGTCPMGDACHLPHYFSEGYEDEMYDDDLETDFSGGDYVSDASYFQGEEEEQLVASTVPICSQWLQGRCRNGGLCGYRHMATTREEGGARVDAALGLSVVSQGAGKLAGAVASKIQHVRNRVSVLRTSLLPDNQHLLTRTLQMVLGRLDSESRDTLLGLPQDIVGLTRFRSVLVKRTLKWTFDTQNLAAIEAVCAWEEGLHRWLPKPPQGDGDFSKFFERHLCHHFMEIVKCQLACPSATFRVDWVRQAVEGSTSPDPLHKPIQKWLGYAASFSSPPSAATSSSSVTSSAASWSDASFSVRGVEWSPKEHPMWPLPFRSRLKLFMYVVKKKKVATRWVSGRCVVGDPTFSTLTPGLVATIFSYLSPVAPEDTPVSERDAGTHPYLSALLTVLVNYNCDVIGVQEAEGRERVGQVVWPLVVEKKGIEAAPHITGMLLQMPPEQLLAEAVNTTRFAEVLEEACDVLRENDVVSV